MKKRTAYDFCPKCGALMRDGTCISCGMTVNNPLEENQVTLTEPKQESKQQTQPESEEQTQPEQETEQQIQQQIQQEPQYDDLTKTEYSYDSNYTKKTYYHGYIPEEQKSKNKKKNTPIIITFVIIAMIVIALVIYIAVSLADSIERARQSADQKKIEEYLFGEDGLPEEYDQEIENSEKYWEDYGSNEGSDFAKNWKEPHENTDPSTVTGPYLDEFKDYINTSVSYEIEREFYEKIEKDNGIYFRIAYIQLKSDDRNFDKINEGIKKAAMLYVDAYEENKQMQGLYDEYGYTYTIEMDSFVTYNDEEKISIVMNTEYHTIGGGITSININLETGTIINNTEIIDVNAEFVKEFCERSNKQNGESFSIDNITNEEKLKLLTDESSLIIFYTPIGLEVGYNFEKDGYTGWVTISLEEYNQYLKKY